MSLRRGFRVDFRRRALACGVAILTLAAGLAPAEATLLPPGFFDLKASARQGAAAVQADRLTYDSRRDLISADGDVVLSYQGYEIRAGQVEYNQQTGAVVASGNVRVTDPAGNVYEADTLEVTGEMREVFLNSLTVTTADGAIISARDVHFSSELRTVLTDAAYSPCGLCVDSKGRRIGWKVKAARLIYDRDTASVTLEQPSLELLGVPVAWLPWFWIPDPSQPRATGLRMPSVNYDPELGATLTVPYFVPVGEDVDVILSPMLMSRQGLLMRGEMTWRLPWQGVVDVQASGLYQLSPSAFAGTVGDRSWRGALQVSGHFVPAPNWSAGWSYSAFTDNAYLTDYNLTKAESSTNQVYATHLDQKTWFDARIQRFNRLGNYSDDAQQGMNVPLVQFDHTQELADGFGRVHVQGELLGVHRDADYTATYATVPYTFGLEGNKVHAMVEGAWEDQFIVPGGLAVTPYLGMRLDGSWYDGSSSLGSAPPQSVLLSATPIAALDMRWPLMAVDGGATHLIEPIAQLVYRGSATSDVGITNDDAQSLVFDTSNLFSYNRFSGIDRQETGLRANIGAHYLGNFGDGSWIDAIAGQSFQLIGPNAFTAADPTLVGTGSGLDMGASYIVAGVEGGLANGFSAGAKLQLDPSAWRVTRAGLGASFAPPDMVSVSGSYLYVAANPTLGTVDDQHEISGQVGIPMFDYWTLTTGLTYDLGGGNWAKANAGIGYDDGYLAFGASANATPTSWGFGLKFGLKGPDGELAF